MRCPWPALRAARAMRTLESVVVLADDPMAAGELAALCAQQGWAFLALDDARSPAFHLTRVGRCDSPI
ncbi:sulfurtransferase TusA family protein [Sphingobium algorifonticola]|uniref:Sulfurtransferase TusA family protein n=2 Tax=Sphingobium algorifonticola TaxID=2008318 RepID=A0A437JDJ4_9SPHN|nr:sulfurtransferase TusA family protein [Sphingobium algorifonticola]